LRDQIDFFRGSINEPDLVKRACRGADYVLHIAARASVPRSVKDPVETNHVNTDGTLQVLLAARDAGVRRVVFSGSSSIYGESPVLPKREDMAPAPISPYGVSKLIGELYGQVFHRVYGLEFVTLRYFNVFGPRQDPGSPYSGVLSLFITNMQKGTAPTVYGSGEQSRDFTFVANVVQANLLACERPGIAGMVFNAGTGQRYTLNQTLALLEKFAGRPSRAQYVEPRNGDILDSQADISLAREKLGYNPSVGFEDGLRRTWEWYCSSH
jgi:UDP-glucose 4-epimerase